MLFPGLTWKLVLLLILAGVLAAILYILLAPGTFFQYWKCKKGSIKGHTAYFEFVSHDHQVCTLIVEKYNSSMR